MHSIVLKKLSMDSGFMLVERVHGPAETDYIPIIRLKHHEAHAIAGPHTGIEFLHAADTPPGDVAKLPLMIEPVPDRARGTRPWRMRIGEDLVTRSQDGEEIPVRLDDDHILSLVDYARPHLPPNEPDWERRRVEVYEEQAVDLRAQADDAALKATSLRAAWEAKQALNQPEMDI